MLDKFYDYLLKNQVIFALFLILAGWFIFEIRGILVSVFISYILMAALLPFVRYLKRNRFPQFLAVMIPYLTIFILLFALILPLIPFFSAQIQSLAKNLPRFVNETTQAFGITVNQKQVESYFSGGNTGISGAFALTSKVFGGVFALFSILVISLYLLLYHDEFVQRFSMLFRRDSRQHVRETLQVIDEKLGAWLRGQIVLCCSIGLSTYIALSILSKIYQPMPYILPLSLIAALLEILPTLGPIIAGFLATIVALTISPTMAILIIIVYFAIQELEAHILVPKIMQRAVGLNPLIVIIGVIIGSHLLGIAGALLSIPFISLLVVLFQNMQEADEK